MHDLKQVDVSGGTKMRSIGCSNGNALLVEVCMKNQTKKRSGRVRGLVIVLKLISG
jgi:hypothetical protein